MKRPTVKDIAAHTGLSPATIDRVLHERGGVSASTRRRVSDAVQALGFGQLPASLTEVRRPALRFRVLLPSIRTGFVRRLEAAVRATPSTVSHADISLEIRWTELIEDELALHLRDLDQVDGIAMFAADTAEIRRQIDRVVGKGIPVVTLVSDCPTAKRCAHFGIDNRAAGRTAGRLTGRFIGEQSGTVAIICGSRTLRDHEDRFGGFREVLSQDFRRLRLLPVIETHGVAAQCRDAVMDLIRDRPDLRGIYSIGGGNSGVIAGLNDAAPAQKPVVIVHELTNTTQRSLIRGEIDAVLDQDTGRIARRMMHRLTARALGDSDVPEDGTMPFQIYFADNLP